MAIRPARISSSMMPQPAGSQFSEACTGQGFQISNRRNRAKAQTRPGHDHWPAPRGSRAIQTPTSSSMTTSPGSVRPSRISARVAARPPVTTIRKSRRPQSGRGRKSNGASRAARAEPAVPGALGESPAMPRRQYARMQVFQNDISLLHGSTIRGTQRQRPPSPKAVHGMTRHASQIRRPRPPNTGGRGDRRYRNAIGPQRAHGRMPRPGMGKAGCCEQDTAHGRRAPGHPFVALPSPLPDSP